MPFAQEPPYDHERPAKVTTGVLYCNLGTPEAPTVKATRRYLAEFLSDSRVVEIPKWIWLLILYAIILVVRPKKSAQKYTSIWTARGSPLMVYTQDLAERLQAEFQERGYCMAVKYAMRYGKPSISKQLDAFKQEGIKRILVLPAYPQYSGTTTASVFDAVSRWMLMQRNIPELRFVKHYYDNPFYIEALAESVREHWRKHGQAQCMVMSFHGVPERTLYAGDPYYCECQKTGRLLAQALGLSKEQYKVTFQSRFGRAKWLEPYTEPTLQALAQQGVHSVEVICPGFTADCLETLKEIQQEAQAAFIGAGGVSFSYIPCLNTSPQWVEGLSRIALHHSTGWVD